MDGGATIDERLSVIAATLNATHAELVDIAVEVLAQTPSWSDWEFRSPEAFLAWQTGCHISFARKVVAIARRVDDLPECFAAFRAGRLSVDQFAPIAKKVPHWADVEICRQAQMMTVDQVARTASRYPFDTAIPKPDGTVDGLAHNQPTPADSTAPEVDEPAIAADVSPCSDGTTPPASQPAAPERVWFGYDDHGRFQLHADLDGDTGSVIENALTEARDSLFQAGQGDVDWADALREVADRSLDTVESPERRNRFKTYIHIEVGGTPTTATGCGMRQHVADYMTCDGARTDIFEVDGVPISVGRTQRIVPERTRQTVIHRDGGCRVPGCHDHRWLDVHHIVHWAEGGPTDTPNLIALCKHHHRQHHRGRLGITGNADESDGITFTNVHGQPIRGRPKLTAPPPSNRRPSGTYRPALRQRIDPACQYFNPPPAYRPYWDHELGRTVAPPHQVA